MMKRIGILVCAVAVLTSSALAAPLVKKDVAADPAAVFHLDFDALLSSSIGKAILANPDVDAKLEAVVAAFNFDLRKQLHGFTAYSFVDQPTNGVIITYADFDSNRLITLARSFTGYQVTAPADGQPIYSWLDDKHTNVPPPRIYAGLSGNRIVLGKSLPVVNAALDVLTGKAQGLTTSSILPATDAAEKVIIIGTARGSAFTSQNPNTAMLKNAKAVRLALGELGPNLQLVIEIQAEDQNAAEQMAQVLNGMLAIAQLGKDQQLSKIANEVKVKSTGATVTASLALPSAQLIDMLHQQEAAHTASLGTTNSTQ